MLCIQATQAAHLVQGIRAGLGRFFAFVREVIEEELLVLFTRVEVMRRQDHGENRYFGSSCTCINALTTDCATNSWR